MIPVDFLYLLRHRITGLYAYLDGGVLAWSSDPIALYYTPDGWQKKAVAWERDLKKLGMVRSFTVTLGFVMDGRQILQQITTTTGFETPLELLIKELHLNIASSTTHEWEYLDFYRGEIDLVKLESEEVRITAPLLEGGIEKALKANESTVYEIPLENLSIQMDGINLRFKKSFSTIEETFVTMNSFPKILPTYLLGAEEGTALNIISLSTSFEATGTGMTLINNANYFLQALDTLQIEAHLRYNITISKGIGTIANPMYYRASVVKVNNNVVSTVAPVFNQILGNAASTHILAYDQVVNFTLNAGDKLFFLIETNVDFPVPLTMNIQSANSDFYFISRFKTTYVNCIRALELFRALIEKITGSKDNCSSTLLENSNLLLYSGDANRGIPGAKIKTSLTQFFEAIKVQYCAGMGIENGRVVIEELSHFLTVTDPIDLGDAKNWKWSFYTDLLFNKVKVGYPEKQIDDVNGKLSSHNTSVFSTVVQSVTTSLDLICPYIADPYYQDIQRMNLENKTSTDNSGDNEVLIAQANFEFLGATAGTFTAPHTVVLVNLAILVPQLPDYTQLIFSGTQYNNRIYTVTSAVTSGADLVLTILEDVIPETYTVILHRTIAELVRETYVNTDTGVPDIHTLYNLGITPKQMLLKWMRYINSCLFQQEGTDLTFVSTEKNRELKFDNGVVVIDEDAPVTIGTERYFKAVGYTFDTVVSSLVPATLSSDPNRGFITQDHGKDFPGILMKGAMAPNTLEPQSFKLLAAPDLNMEDLQFE